MNFFPISGMNPILIETQLRHYLMKNRRLRFFSVKLKMSLFLLLKENQAIPTLLQKK